MNPGIIQVRVALIVAALIASVAADEPNGSTIAKDPCALAMVPRKLCKGIGKRFSHQSDGPPRQNWILDAFS